MKSVAILAIVLAVFAAQVSAWSNSSNSSNHSSSVRVVFESRGYNHSANVSAHFNHQDDVIITVCGANSSNYTKPVLNLTNLAGEYWIQNASGILSVINHTNSSTTYKFNYYGVFTSNRPCVLTYNNMTCRFKLSMPNIHESTDLYFTFDQPYSYMPSVSIVGAGYNNRTWDRSTIYAKEVEHTEYLKQFINLTLTGDYYGKNFERYLDWNASNFNAFWMISSMEPKFLGFQCWGSKSFNLIANWTGKDYISWTPVNLSKIGIPFDDFYVCNMTVVFTESNNRHAFVPIQVQGPIVINGSQSNHSNHTNTTSDDWVVYAGYNKGCNISANFTRWDGVDLTVTNWGANYSHPTMNLTNYAGHFPLYNTSGIFREIRSSNRSVTYRFNYWEAIGNSGPCVSYETYSVGCRFKLSMSGVTTDLFVTITRPFLGQNISIYGTGYDNTTWNSRFIDLNRADYTEYLLRSVYLTIDSDYYSQSRVRYLNWNASNFNASWMMANLQPVAFGFQCTESQNGSYINVVVNYTGSDGFYQQTPVNLTQLPRYGHWTCNMSVIATEQRNNHAMIQINVRNQFYINGSANYSGYWHGPQGRSNFSEYRPLPNTSYTSNQTYYYNNTGYNYSYFNQSRNSSYTHGNASWYSQENPYFSNSSMYYPYHNQSYFYNNSRTNTSHYNQSYNNQSWRYPYNYTNGTNSSYRGDFCDQYENRLNPICLEKKVQQAKLINKILIGCVGILALGLLILACKVCCGQKKTQSRDGSPQNSYIEFGASPANTSRPQMVIHGAPTQPMQTMVPAQPAYLITGNDGGHFMVIPQKI